MKKIYLIAVVILISTVTINFFTIRAYRKNRIDFQKEVLSEQSRLVGRTIEKYISDYENDLRRILFRNIRSFPEIFDDTEAMNAVTKDLKNFNAKYRNLINNIAVYDNKNEYLGIYVRENEEVVLDTFPKQGLNQLMPREKIIKKGENYHSYFPFFRDNNLYGNVEVEIDMRKYLKSILNDFKLEGISWQWVIDTSENVLFTNLTDSIKFNNFHNISNAIASDTASVFMHNDSEGHNFHGIILSAVYPLSMLNKDLGIVFSIACTGLMYTLMTKEAIWLGISLFLVLLLIIYLIYVNYKNEKFKSVKVAELISLKMIVEHFPVGIMVQDSLGKIKYINRTGQRMLFINDDEQVIGKQSNEFLISNKYLLKDGYNVPFDSNHFIHYEKDGNEVVVYRKDAKKYVEGDELIISALIDVSPLEKSRKQEAAANMAKSEFLAKMSHEIRTPMNGIVCMAGNLLKGKLDDHEKQQVQIIKQSCDLLINIINDILDLSKIEAGRMMLEEIPFILRDEINICLELFRPVASEKGVRIITIIPEDIPDSFIGDPFRIRQVISNLISNAIKFTGKGKIILEVRLIEKYDLVRSLLFSISDTGIGISKENFGKIFASYEQGKTSLSRNYGGTGLGTAISRQLVEMMNGEIWVESPSGISEDPELPGSKFSFSIEVYSNEPLVKKYDYSSITQFQNISILILSKNRDENETIYKLFDQLGINYHYRIYEESGVDILMHHITQRRDIYKLIIILDKPKYDGFEIAGVLKENEVSDYFPIIIVSSNDQQGNYVKSKTFGIDHYLIQPFEYNELYKILTSIFPGITPTEKESVKNKIKSDLQILLVEDNLLRLRVTQNLFKKIGFEIDMAKNGIEALELISRKKYDIIFMDIIMPDMDGIIATKEIRKRFGDILPIIAITADEDNTREGEALEAGMNDYITKPVRIEVIKKILLKWFSESK